MKAKPAPITIPYRLRLHAKAAGNSEPMLAQSAAMDINENLLDNSSRTPSPGISAAMEIDGNLLDNSLQFNWELVLDSVAVSGRYRK